METNDAMRASNQNKPDNQMNPRDPHQVVNPPPAKKRLATVWLTGCSGCHMSFLDLDEWLFELAELADIVYSPVASDQKDYPAEVDICLVEGGVGTSDNLRLIRQVRQRTRVLISFGDCAITANVPGMRNNLASIDAVLSCAYGVMAETFSQLPDDSGIVPKLLDRVLPVHELVPVDLYLPGCPPSASRIRAALEPLLHGQWPELSGPELISFG
jgi:NAD-reducing hydrogenase small subunit